MTKYDLINKLKMEGILKSYSVEQALLEVDRSDFVLAENKGSPFMDTALSIGYGQTISQPLTVVFILELLDVKQGDIVMDVGTGSGWLAALLGFLTGEGGHVHTVEIIQRLSDFAVENVSKYPLISEQVTFHKGNAVTGLPDVAREIGGFDRIVSSAEVKGIPTAWKDQLKIGGTLVFPKDRGIYKMTRNTETDFDSLFFPGFVFVPFIEG